MGNPSRGLSEHDRSWMALALRLARRGYGQTSPNPMVGAVLVKAGKLIGQGWHHQAGEPHAEIEALRDSQSRRQDPAGATLYVTLEPCSTHGRTPPCTEAILASNIRRVVAGATDPNPKHAGRGFDILRQAGLQVVTGVEADAAAQLNEAFNHWIVQRTPYVTLKAAMSLDGKIATAFGESKWITGAKARACGMKLRQGADAILVGVNTILADNPGLTVRGRGMVKTPPLRRIVLDSEARTPTQSQVVSDEWASLTTVVVSRKAPVRRVAQLKERVQVLVGPTHSGKIDVSWLLARLGSESVTSLLVEGGGEVHASFLQGGMAQRIVFFYAPKILGGRTAPGPVGGKGVARLAESIALTGLRWRRLGHDFLLTARIDAPQARPRNC
jgi:diaminohydroxyphosphoribosylaminopyrimidine deaminase / 5-amino-6-(5-phosphoribosylamino)uracil reductase